ncbi:MAG: hypothetical protein KAI94_06365 [Anaerolineales bacterium]|nr:hypothetical protein [Anaerolineales bacterium]
MSFLKNRWLWVGLGILLIVVIIIIAWNSFSGGEPTPTPQDPEAVYTAAALTADAKMTEAAGTTPSPTLTDTPAPTDTDTPVPTADISTSTATLPPSPPPGGADKAQFVADVTVPDGTNFPQGEAFTKTWRLNNVGTSTWTTAYSVVYYGGEQMDGTSPTPLSGNVPPGQTMDISVDMVAPDENGNYIGYWILSNSNQQTFGVGPNGDQSFYVEINVVGGANTATPTSTDPTSTPGTVTTTPQVTVTATPEEAVTSASLSVDEADVDGTCPHTFNFTAQLTLSRAATVTYQLEADTGFEITLPDPTTVSLEAGTHTAIYTLQFTDSFSGGVAQFHVTQPNDVLSDQVNFSLTCQ